MTFSTTTLGVKRLFVTLSIAMLCHYAECLHAECDAILIVILNVVMLSVVATLYRVAIYILVQKASVFYTYKIFQL